MNYTYHFSLTGRLDPPDYSRQKTATSRVSGDVLGKESCTIFSAVGIHNHWRSLQYKYVVKIPNSCKQSKCEHFVTGQCEAVSFKDYVERNICYHSTRAVFCFTHYKAIHIVQQPATNNSQTIHTNGFGT